jgi:epoxyqueuosine reductase
MKAKSLTSDLKAYIKNLNVDLVGIAQATQDTEVVSFYQNFLKEKRYGDMKYLKDNFKNADPQKLLPGAKSIIVIGLNYYQQKPAAKKEQGLVARYAHGRDYHKVIRSILKKVETYLREKEPAVKTKICVDSAPLFEKYYAVKAGLGFIGKNTTVINPQIGSFFVLGEMITDLELVYDKPMPGSCGTCERCLAACPTKALTAPKKLDARRCVSYLTIEKKGSIPAAYKPALKTSRYIFGCDICQEVCPYNKAHAKPTKNPDFNKPIAGHSIRLKEIIKMKTDAQYVARFAGSPLMRAKLKGLKRNARALKRAENKVKYT